MNSFDPHALSDRVAVVTGAAGGLGRAVVGQLMAMGAHVVALDVQAAARPSAATPLSLACDVTDEAALEQAARTVAHEFGRCDVLVNCAGVLPGRMPLQTLTEASWDEVLDVNLKGTFLCCRHFGRRMLERRGGSIVNLASIAASLPNAVAAYGASKAAVLALTRQIAVEWGPMGVRANAVSPGLVRTPMSEAFYADPANLAVRQSRVASRRIGSPTEVASVIAFLACDASAYVNGQEIVVDGGFMQTGLMDLQQRS